MHPGIRTELSDTSGKPMAGDWISPSTVVDHWWRARRDVIDQLEVGPSKYFDASFHGPPGVSSGEYPNHPMQAEGCMPRSTGLSAARSTLASKQGSKKIPSLQGIHGPPENMHPMKYAALGPYCAIQGPQERVVRTTSQFGRQVVPVGVEVAKGLISTAWVRGLGGAAPGSAKPGDYTAETKARP